MRRRMTNTEARKLYSIRCSSQQNMDFTSWLLYYSIVLDDTFVESSGSNYSNSDSSSYSSDSSSCSSSCD